MSMIPAETTLWAEARRREEARVAAQRAKMEAQGKTSSTEHRPDNVDKPWTWQSAGMGALNDLDDAMIATVTTFDFDLEDPGFQAFLKATYQLHRCRTPQSVHWTALQDTTIDRSAFMASDDFRYAQEYKGSRHRYSDRKMASLWRLFARTRVYLQGAWDVYVQRVVAPDGQTRRALARHTTPP